MAGLRVWLPWAMCRSPHRSIHPVKEPSSDTDVNRRKKRAQQTRPQALVGFCFESDNRVSGHGSGCTET
ncbi:hypothetical protein [Microbulbifer sp. 2205BS26-8]|uniref:hypothetical protein n=1 Tax=Microbulbifer sp. 2205BS26-8 TaxID=3064386 RepID=UPI00273FF02B|nr:hypothetical protein [Microbulbifer sp. 2205BS26-8]MDP5208579.1 hypothetical protein [Microbulbifer sp. 2205BS26-8]